MLVYHHHLFSGFILVWDDTLRYFLNGIKIILQPRIISIVTGYNNSGLGDLQMFDIKLNITQPSRHWILKSRFLCELRVYFVNAVICLCRDGFYNGPQFIATISQQFLNLNLNSENWAIFLQWQISSGRHRPDRRLINTVFLELAQNIW